MKLSELILKRECPLKANLKFKVKVSGDNKQKSRKRKVREIFLDENIKTISELKKIDNEYLREIFEDDIFDSEKEKEAYIKGVLLRIDRFSINLNEYTDVEMIKNKGETVDVGKNKIYLSSDIIFETDNNVFISKIIDSEAKVKNNGRTESTKSSKSLELYCLYKLGEKLYPNKNIIAGLLYLKEKSIHNYRAIRDSIDKEDEEYFDNMIKDLEGNKDFTECDNCSKICEYYPICSYTHSLEEYRAVEVEESMIKERELPVINFSDEQKKVIQFNKGYGVVNAVAGAGKTTVLSKRVERLLTLDGCDPEDIVIISFSEKTIDEFKEKLSEKFGIDDFENVYTFNGFGDKLLKEEFSLFGYSRPPILMDEIVKCDIIKEIIDSTETITELDEINAIWENPSGMIVKKLNYEMMFPSGGFGVSLIVQIKKIFDDIKAQGLSYTSEEFIEDKYSEFAENVVAQKKLSGEQKSRVLYLYKKFLRKIYSERNSMYGKYDYILKDRGYYDYADQVNCLVSSFSNPRLKDKFKFKHIICDEFQDSNTSAMMVLKKLTLNEKFKSLLVVGDVNQSIYGFQGATPENLITFERYFPGEVQIFDISYSYRVPQVVARKANALMNTSINIKYNKMNAFKKEEGLFGVLSNKKELLNSIKEGIKNEKTIGIIARNNDDLNDFIEILVKNDIPYAVKSNLYIMKKPKVVNLNNLYKVLINPEDNRIELLKYLMVADNETFTNKFKTEEFELYFEEKYNNFLKLIDTKNLAELLKVYYSMLEPLARKDYMIETYLNNIKRTNPKTIDDVGKYCYKLEIYTPTIKVPENNLETNVILTTGHSSKGREFDIVIMDTSTFSASGEEDRRLFYVSMTRAKEQLLFINLKRRIAVSKKKSCEKYLEIINRAN